MYAIVLLSIAIHSCYMGSKVVVSLLALDLGASQLTVGVLAAFYAIAPLLLGVYSGRLVDRIGMRLPMLVGASCMVVAMLAGFLLPQLAGLVVVSILVGISFVFFNVSVQNVAGNIGRPEHRTRNFSILAIGYSVSAFVGPMFAGFSIDHNGHALTFLYFALFALLPVVLLAARRQLALVATAPRSEEKHSTLALLRDVPLRNLIITSGLCVASAELFGFYVPVFSHSIGLSASTIGVILGAYAAAVFVSRFMLPVMTRRWRVDQIMSTLMLIAAFAFAVFPLLRSIYPLIAMALVIGFGVGCAQPLLMALSYEKSPPGRTGEVTGLRFTANNIARVTIPLVSGALGVLLGAAPVFWLNAVNLTAISWLSRR
ncbi:MAG: MFS transporter [Gammaproteobacteria bacterium]|nr:MFS transporter [Gammaproteobacteria bacterium]MDH3413778.1 MFS transporter [Gammaproteobacteria bacterium]